MSLAGTSRSIGVDGRSSGVQSVAMLCICGNCDSAMLGIGEYCMFKVKYCRLHQFLDAFPNLFDFIGALQSRGNRKRLVIDLETSNIILSGDSDMLLD